MRLAIELASATIALYPAPISRSPSARAAGAATSEANRSARTGAMTLWRRERFIEGSLHDDLDVAKLRLAALTAAAAAVGAGAEVEEVVRALLGQVDREALLRHEALRLRAHDRRRAARARGAVRQVDNVGVGVALHLGERPAAPVRVHHVTARAAGEDHVDLAAGLVDAGDLEDGRALAAVARVVRLAPAHAGLGRRLGDVEVDHRREPGDAGRGPVRADLRAMVGLQARQARLVTRRQVHLERADPPSGRLGRRGGGGGDERQTED